MVSAFERLSVRPKNLHVVVNLSMMHWVSWLECASNSK